MLLWTIEHTIKTLDISVQRFAHHGHRQAYRIESESKGNDIYTIAQ